MKKGKRSIVVGLMALSVGMVTLLSTNLSAYSIRDIFNEEVLETRIDETIPLNVSETQLGFMRVVANTFVDNLDVNDDHQATESGFLDLEIDGKSRNLSDQILRDENEIYMSAADLSKQLAYYLEYELDNGTLLKANNVTRAVKVARTTIPAIRYNERVYLPVGLLSDILDIALKHNTIDLIVNTKI